EQGGKPHHLRLVADILGALQLELVQRDRLLELTPHRVDAAETIGDQRRIGSLDAIFAGRALELRGRPFDVASLECDLAKSYERVCAANGCAHAVVDDRLIEL